MGKSDPEYFNRGTGTHLTPILSHGLSLALAKFIQLYFIRRAVLNKGNIVMLDIYLSKYDLFFLAFWKALESSWVRLGPMGLVGVPPGMLKCWDAG